MARPKIEIDADFRFTITWPLVFSSPVPIANLNILDVGGISGRVKNSTRQSETIQGRRRYRRDTEK